MPTTSALLRGAASVREQIATYQDQVMAYEYGNSAFTDTSFSQYSAYLKSRIAQLSTSGSVANASKALSLTKALDSATKSNISASIQRENISVLSGNATLTDKYNVVAQQFVRAQANGDMTLAQTLEGQAYSLSQTIQQQQQQAANAYAANNGKSWADTAKGLETALDKFNTQYADADRKSATSVVSDYMKQLAPELAKVGIHLQPGVQPNYFDLVDGMNRAIYKAYQNAATVSAPSGGDQPYIDKANNALLNIKTIYGTMNAQQLQDAQANPGQFGYKEDPQYQPSTQGGVGGKLNPQTGYQYTNQGIKPTFSATPWIDIPNNLNNQIKALSLQTVTKTGNGIEVTATANSPAWVKQIIPSDATTHIMSDAQGNLQFEADAQHGTGKAVYTVAKDNTVWESSNLGDRLISGTPTSASQPQQPTSVFGRVGENFMNGMKSVMSLFASGTAYAAGLPSNMLNQATSHYTLPPIPVVKPLSMPSISVAAPVAQPKLSVTPAINPYPAAKTVNPQTTIPSTTIQGGSTGINIQGGGSSLQGGGGFRLQ